MERDIVLILALSIVGIVAAGGFMVSIVDIGTPSDSQYEYKYTQDLNYTENQYVESTTDKDFLVVASLDQNLTRSEFNQTVTDIESTGVTVESTAYSNRTVVINTTPIELRNVAGLDSVVKLDTKQ